MRTASATMPSDCEIVIERTYDAPASLVWKAWTDPAHLALWWGPVGFRTSTSRFALKPGGDWRFVMHGPDGTDYQNHITFLEVSEPRKLVYKHGGDVDCEPVNFQVEVTFEPVGPGGIQTKLTMRSVFSSKAARDFVVNTYNAVEGGKQTLGRLAEHLAHGTNTAEADMPFLITRVFNAPIELVWQTWTQESHLAKWFGPRGSTITRCTMDLRIGGTFHYGLRMPDGSEHWGLWTMREIVEPRRLTFTVSFADANGNPVRNPWNPDWPMRWLSTVTFNEHAGKGKGTVVAIEWIPLEASETERRIFHEGRSSMQMGWTGTLDRLVAHLGTGSGT